MAPTLYAFELGEGTAWPFTAEHGLPAMPTPKEWNNNYSIVLAPIEPGKVCAVGYAEENWIATASFEKQGDNGKRSIDVFHTASIAPKLDDASQARNTGVAFPPSWGFAIMGVEEKIPTAAIFGRNSTNSFVNEKPLEIDFKKRTVAISSEPLPGTSTRGILRRTRSLGWARTGSRVNRRVSPR
jgi:hypothetical protein